MISMDITMPGSCVDCPCNYDDYICNLLHIKFWKDRKFDVFEGRLPDCPLVDMSDDGK